MWCGSRFSRFIDNTLLHCSKIHKLHILSDVDYNANEDHNFNSKLRFAIKREVEEIVLELKNTYADSRLPDFVFNHASLVKLKLHSCQIVHVRSVSWKHLKVLSIEKSLLSDQAIEDILSSSPVLESLEINQCFGHNLLAIASNSLKNLVIIFGWEYDSAQEGISCFRISCGKLTDLRLSGYFNFSDRVEFKDLLSLICATLDFGTHCCGSMGNLLQQLQHAELNFGSNFIRLLSELEDNDDYEDLSCLLLSNKSLILDSPDFGWNSAGIAFALRMSHVLGRLVIKDPVLETSSPSNNFWNTSGAALHFCVLHLKTVHITSLSKRNDECKVLHDFVRHLMKNAILMENLVISKDDRKIL